MKRLSIGLGILVTFFLLAMFLMSDAEGPAPLGDSAVVTPTRAPAR